MPTLSGHQQSELVKFLESLGYGQPMNAADANEVDDADDIKAIEVKPKARMKAAARAAPRSATTGICSGAPSS